MTYKVFRQKFIKRSLKLIYKCYKILSENFLKFFGTLYRVGIKIKHA